MEVLMFIMSSAVMSSIFTIPVFLGTLILLEHHIARNIITEPLFSFICFGMCSLSDAYGITIEFIAVTPVVIGILHSYFRLASLGGLQLMYINSTTYWLRIW